MRYLAALALLAAPLLAERAVRLDGEVIEKVAAADGHVARGKKRFAFAEFHLVEHDDGRLVWAPDFRARLRGYEFVARHRGRGALAGLAREAVKLGLPDDAEGLLARARSLGLPDADGDAIEKEIAKAKPKAAAPEARERLAREAAAAEALLPQVLVERAKAADAREDGLRLLREALLLEPEHPGARELLAEHAPKDFALGDARFWLDWHLDLEVHGGRPASEDELELKRARAHWRKDLYGVVAPPVLLITPVRDTRVVGRCLAYGRLTCETLAKLFATDQPMKRRATPVTIFLYTDKAEYRKHSGAYGRIEDRASLDWTAGHYSPQEQVSRFYWYRDPDSERRIVGTCVHELTHHWIEEQNPRFAASQIRHEATPGHWIVEGFATFMEEGRYAPEKGVADLFNPRSRSLDVVAALAAGGSGLFEWKRFYGLTGRDFGQLPAEHTTPVIRRWSLFKELSSERRVFYEQGGATCAYLFHAENGKYRSKLLDYVVHYYTGQRDKLDPATAFGIPAEELGKRVVEFAREVAAGRKP